MATRLDDLSFLNGANIGFIEELYERYRLDPATVEPDWREIFDDLDRQPATMAGMSESAVVGGEDALARTRDSLRVLMLIRAYRVRGHLIADLDPLGLEGQKHHPELDPATYGFGDADYDREFFLDGVLGHETATLRQVLEIVKQVYCSKIGIEFMHIQYPAEKSWIQQRVENTLNRTNYKNSEKLEILEQLDTAEGFERFLHAKYPATKRFSIEGAESLVPALEAIIRISAGHDVEEVVFGMPHRGRINILTTVMGKPYMHVFSEFQGGASTPEDVLGSGDVKYHLGTSTDRELPDGRKIHLSMTANPSHLEWVNPVVMGRVRAKQGMIGDAKHKRVMSVLMHGDAAFAGQGIVAETLGMSELRGHRTGGTLHIIVNNQIGFTTSPKYSRSSPYPSDVAKTVQAPIIHVNGDNPEAVVHAATLAADFRHQFGRDVVLDIFCYRRYGHNEADEPAFTQPLMYKRIDEMATARQLYTERLVGEGVLTAGEADQRLKTFQDMLAKAYEEARDYSPQKADWLEGEWAGIKVATESDRRGKTGVALTRLRKIGAALCHYPEGFNAHRKIDRFLDQRRKAIESGENIDWATAEALAFGTLVTDGHTVRLSGQDSGRGTFSQRHSVLVDQKTEERHIPLNYLSDDQAHYDVTDSMLSEAAVMGYEYGYTLADPNSLVLWEAQFGDFANTAQVIIDQFICAGESKWLRMSGLVLLLPHGYEGQGPEHSSARMERYLQSFAEDNIQVANCTTPANYFHVLRRQLHRKFRKPLILMTPKSLLRHKAAVSTLDELGSKSSFHRVLPETAKLIARNKVKRVVLCSGKVYYDLVEERARREFDDIAVIRVEQLAPFPSKSLADELKKYPKAEVIWCQDEPQNMGAWTFVAPFIEEVLIDLNQTCKRPRYVGRKASASTSTGMIKTHQREQAALVKTALEV
jgi:2-oxoglutarate dehydrogenase E1 component